MKTKFEKPDTAKTAATFTAEEISSFAAAGQYAQHRRELYMQKVLSRPKKSDRLDESGAEVLSSISTVADVDLQPLSMREQLGRFYGHGRVQDDGFYDSETPVDENGNPVAHVDDDFHISDSTDIFPTPHELRSKKLIKRLSKAREDHQKGLDDRRKAGDSSQPTPPADPANPTPDAPSGQ